MSTVFTLTTPLTVGSLGNSVTVAALKVSAIWLTSTPKMAPIGTGQLYVTLTETTNGWQETIQYQDATVLSFLGAAAVAPAAGATFADQLGAAIFTKLIADGKLPTGTVSMTPAAAASATAG